MTCPMILAFGPCLFASSHHSGVGTVRYETYGCHSHAGNRRGELKGLSQLG
jgi:hypothetical protein